MTSADHDQTQAIQAQVATAAREGLPLRIRGGGSKDFYGRATRGELLDLSGHRGIRSYEPTELVVTARGGTPLAELEAALAERGQMLPFEPPRFGLGETGREPGGATVGGAVASGLAGPRRPWGGAPRDLLLGVKILDGAGRVLTFGGQVMKNVAGYDVSRLMAGALGTLGVLLEVSLKVLPRPREEWTLIREGSAGESLDLMARLQGRPLPLTGACHLDGRLYLRLASGADEVRRLAGELGAEVGQGTGVWGRLRNQRLPFFDDPRPLWRLSVPPAWRDPGLAGDTLIDWGGAQRWLKSDESPTHIRDAAAQAGGHATLFRGGDREGAVFHPLAPGQEALHRRLKAVFDPAGILNPGRMYPGL